MTVVKAKGNPTELDIPVYLMNFPFSLDTMVANNVWMKRLPPDQRRVDYGKAYSQWRELYKFLATDSLVYILPSSEEFQDQVYVANLGMVLNHQPSNPMVLLSKFRSLPRRGEEEIGRDFFEDMGYEVDQPPYFWEGEADLKHLRGNIYVGGYGIRTELKAYHWMMDHFDMEIIPIEMTDEWLYHFDCWFFPLTPTKVLLCDQVDKKYISRLQKYADVILVPKGLAKEALTNCVRCYNYICCSSDLMILDRHDSRYMREKEKADFLLKVCVKDSLEPVFFNLSEFEKSGAALSCLVMHLNRASYKG